MKHWWASSIAALLALPAWHASQAQGVQVYRCTAADGSVALQDSPCAKDTAQQLRTLKRPPAGVPAPVPEAQAADAEAPPPETPVPPGEPEPVAATPLFECITHDGQTYQNETGIGEMRWVPLWVLGMDPAAPARTFQRTGATPAPPRDAPRAPAKAPDTAAPGAGTWIRDTCYELSPDVVCERMRERVAEVRRKRRLAQTTARVPLDAEYSELSARLATQCN